MNTMKLEVDLAREENILKQLQTVETNKQAIDYGYDSLAEVEMYIKRTQDNIFFLDRRIQNLSKQ